MHGGQGGAGRRGAAAVRGTGGVPRPPPLCGAPRHGGPGIRVQPEGAHRHPLWCRPLPPRERRHTQRSRRRRWPPPSSFRSVFLELDEGK
ncbi:hypothetical protein MUK42_20307 [Musa troglodytarum]|uniref:Uncharacterized protein n=1 Tax=Musa troglodytarum TaxID=320322 RepID=A0A9E7G3K0_9LILI|nr:hypothetical protein MUK42_20307 [Musa troglodytarum]